MYLAAKPAGVGVPMATAIARRLVETSDANGDGRVGWGPTAETKAATCAGPGTRAGLAAGTCNPAGTKYTYQTGLAMACLAKVGKATGETSFIATAEAAARASWAMGRDNFPCRGCFTYWPSYSPNDRDRYIRNMNVTMGMGLAALYTATGNKAYLKRARAVGNSELWEVKQDNRGYLSAADSGFAARSQSERTRTENHLPLVAIGVRDIGIATGNLAMVRAAGQIIEHWLTCTDKRCAAAGCTYWAGNLQTCNVPASLSACPLRGQSAMADAQCRQAASRLTSWTNLALWLIYAGVSEP